METKKNNNKKKDNLMFAFLPDMVIDHINQPEHKEFKSVKLNTEPEQSINPLQSVVFDPLADPFDGVDIEIEPGKKAIKEKKRAK